MKKYLFFIISMLCVSIGAWAQDPDPATSGKFGASGNSDWELTGTSPNQTLTLTFKDANDKPLVKEDHTDWVNWVMPCDITGVTKVVVKTGTGVTLSGGADSPLASLSDNYKSIPLLDLSEASVNIASQTSGTVTSYYLPIADASSPTPLTFKNIIVPASFANNPDGLIVCNRWNYNQSAAVNKFSVSGTTINAALYTAVGDIAVLTDIKSDYTKLKIVNEVGAIDLTSVLPADKKLDLTSITTESTGSNTITVNSGTTVVCLTSEVAARVSGGTTNVVNPVVSCTASQLDTKLSELAEADVTPTSITITGGTLSTEQMTAFGSLTGLKYLSLEADAGTNIGSLALPSTLEALVLPKKASDTKSSVTDAMKTHANLKYIYAPFSGTQDKDQIVADYVWVNKPGGLSKAFDEQAGLRNAWYMIVESTVALNDDDVNFWGSDPEHARPMQYRYLDLSGANITPAVLANYKVTDNLPYRIILPNDWTGDMMAVFAANPNKGSIAAVYSYTGTDHKRLDILELNDYAYLHTALNDSRIVRSGTTSIRVVSGHYGNNPVYSKFGDNLLAAINNAASSIKSVTIAVGTGVCKSVDTNADDEDDEDQAINTATPFIFDNDNLTNLDLSYTNNSNVTIDVSRCAGLTNFQMNEATVAAVDAHGINGLATVSLGHTTVGGDVDLSNTNSTNTSLTSDLEVDLANIGGTLNVSGTNATSFDFTQLTAKSVNASNTNSLTSLNINGIKLNGMSDSGSDAITAENITNRIGTVEVTRDEGGDYSGLTITTASSTEFTTDRIVPKLSEIADNSKKYTLTAIEPSHVEISAAGNLLNSTVPAALETYNEAQDPDENNTVANIERLHVTGTLTAEDITYIQTSLTGLKLLDLSDCTFAEGVIITNITSSTIPTSVAIVLPGTINTEAGKIADVKALVDDGYECVAYYTTKTTEVKNMNIYATNGTVGNLEANAPDLINSQSCITFLPRYANTTVGSDQHQYPEVTPSFLSGLQTFVNGANGGGGVGCVDLTWINISKLGVDFSELNTYHLVIPQNTTAATVTRNGIIYDNDFTKEDDGTATSAYKSTDSHKYYKYNANTYAVSTYKGTASPYATQAYFDGESYQYGSGYGQINKTATLTYLRTTGRLGYAYGYMPQLLKDANIISIAGTLDSEDIIQSGSTTSLSDFTNPYIDLTHASFADSGENPVSNETWTSFSNSSVKDIAMPYNYATTLAGLPQVGTCENLQGIATLVKSDDVLSEPTKKSTLVYQSYKEGGMEGMLPMLHALNLIERAYSISTLTIGGPVCAKDIANRINGIDANGHLVTTIENGCITGVAAGTQGGALSGYAAIESWDFSKATLPTYTEGANVVEGNRSYRFDNATHTYAKSESSASGFSYQNDLCYTQLGIAPATSLTGAILPTDNSVWRIADNALNNCKLLANAEIHIPYNYQYIGNGAFLDTYIEHITTTDASGHLIDNGANTYTLSANVKEIGNEPTPAGASLSANQTVFPQNRPVFDMYILATDVPKCYKGAFPANMLYGWGGFQGGDFPYCRDKYVNGTNYYTVLRFPYKDAFVATEGTPDYDTMKKRYTDVNKIYTKKEQTGAVDANGDEILWPTFSELRRAYNQATNDNTWNDWTTTYDINHEVNGGDNIPTTSQPEGGKAGDYDFSGYEGWHQFTLSQATYVEPDYQNAKDREYVQAGWYTFCIPFDMTEDQVYEMLGVPYSTAQYTNTVGTDKIKHVGQDTGGDIIDRILPEIRTLHTVDRYPGTSGTTNVIRFSMTKNLTTAPKVSGRYDYLAIDNSEDEPENSYEDCGLNAAGEKIVIKGGHPYYIRPYLQSGITVKNLGKYVMSRYGDKFKQTASCANNNETMEYLGGSGTNLATLKFAKPFEEHKIQAFHHETSKDGYATHSGTNKKYYYTFIGQFWDQKLPRYCYYTLEGTGQWYRLASNKNYTWNAYKCVILCTQEVEDEHTTSGHFRNNENGHSNYPSVTTVGTQNDLLNGTLKIEFLDGIDDYDFVNSARETMFIFDDDIVDVGDGSETTAIDTLDGERILPATGKVYNMNGQHVGNSLNGLPKGMYIVNGKKYVIK
jgi:hypothetical protein